MCTTCTPTCGCPATKPFDPTKPVQSRSGLSARIICTDKKGSYPIIALLSEGSGEYIAYRRADGTAEAGAGYDLVNVPERTVRYINMCTNYLRSGELIRSKSYEHAGTAIAGFSTLKLTFEDGKLISSEVIR